MPIQMVVEFHEDKVDGVVTVHTCCGPSVQSNDVRYALHMAMELVTKLHAERDEEASLSATEHAAKEALLKAAKGPLH